MSSPAATDSDPLNERLHGLLREHFSFPHFRKGQLDILRSVSVGKDTLAVMPTGGGKSLCYQIPALDRPGIVLVVSPLISLMKDQVRALQDRGIPAGALHTGQEYEEKLRIFSDLRKQERFLLYLSPERVQKAGFADWIKTQNISLFAIDEAHCVSQWGPDFRQDYHRLNLLRELRPEVPILALTATATPQVLRDIAKQLNLREPDRHVYGFYRPNLYYQVEPCENDAVKRALLRRALAQHPEGRALVYCGTRKQCEEITADFAPDFAAIDYYHAGLPSERRHSVQRDFEDGRTRILVATNAFGMGIDRPDVRLVVHYQMPANVESYYQEIGRAGRDGKDATCLMLYSKKDKGLHSYFITQSEATEHHRQLRWRGLETIVQFAEGGECRHGGILTYFRDSFRLGACGHCDVCLPDSPRRIPRLEEIPAASLSRGAKAKAKKVSEVPLTGDSESRYEVLKSWRKEFALSRDVPAFLVFSDKTLRELARQNPQSLDALAEIYGLGEKKIDSFGKELLAQLKPWE
ncbi:MAG: ATP-dependent DNA helicase [Deltaproteobacteria bacterium]|nr:ATP-dependent DNA helicase [Deltaproteobacteria bacterium]